jgi:hypothetical protein
VLSAQGTINMHRDSGTAKNVTAMALLRPGDRLNPENGASAVLYFLKDGHRERLKENTQASVREGGLLPAEAGERIDGPKLKADNLDSLRELTRSNSRGAIGVLRGDDDVPPQVVQPLYGTTLLTDRPDFSWLPAKKADAYFVELLSGAEGPGQRVLWKKTTKTPRLLYPENEKPLQLGLLYRWRVSPVIGEDRGEPIVASKFTVLTKGEVEALAWLDRLSASKSPEDWVTAAALYEAHGAISHALPLYERLAQRFPGEAAYQMALARYYQRAGRPELARKAKDQAKKLGVQIPSP